MHIGFVIDTYDEGVNAGGVISTRRFVELLRKEGHKVTIISTGKESKDKVVMQAYDFSVPYINNIMNRFKIVLAKPDDEKLKDILKKLDVVHVQFPFHLGKRTIELANELNVPVVSSFHVQAENITYNINLNYQRVIDKLYNYFMSNIYNKSLLVIAPSKFAKEELLRYGFKGNIEIVTNGTSDKFKFLNLKKENDRFTVLTVGRLGKEKKQDIILRAVASSKYKDNIQLIVVGDGPCRESLIDLGKEFNITPRFLRGISDEELVKLYNISDLYVHAGEVELECMTVLEAMSCALVPLISNSDKSAAPQFALDENSLFEKGDYKDLIKKIDYWYLNRKELENKKLSYLNEAKKYNINDSVCKLISIYEQAIELQKKNNSLQKVETEEISRFKLLRKYFNF